jgi:hypothetical protein
MSIKMQLSNCNSNGLLDTTSEVQRIRTHLYSTHQRRPLDVQPRFNCKRYSTRITSRMTPNAKYVNAEDAVHLDSRYRYAVWVSFIEIYNDKIFDLLDAQSKEKRQNLAIHYDANKNSYVHGLQCCYVSSYEVLFTLQPTFHKTLTNSCYQEAIQLLKKGKQSRTINATEKNSNSSRSHTIFSIKLISTDEDNEGVSWVQLYVWVQPHVFCS